MAFLFVICFQRNAGLFYASVALWIGSLTTDVLDGYFARRLHADSINGRLWDSLGDKSFYAAVIVAFNSQGFLGPLISWALITREIALYITRVLFIEKLPNIEQIRPWTNWHGYFMYLTIALGLSQMYADIHSLSFPVYPYLQASAYAALLFGIGSIIHFLKLK
jgi:phosphatidylglycerophosphate synthase